MYDGILDLSLVGYIVATLIMTHITIAAVTIFLHRHQAHRALDLHPVISHFFRFWLWLTTGMVTKAWTAIHRKHHAKVETEEDPHSPQVYGIKKVLLEGAELYRGEAQNQETLDRYGHGTPDDWMEHHVYTPHSTKGIGLLLAIDLMLFGFAGITIWAVQMLWIPFFAAGVINGIGHWWGYRNYEVPDASTNIVPWGILIGGEELHNNHHTFASSAKLSNKWWEFDIGWMYIRIMQFFGLARVKKVPPKPMLDPTKPQPDFDTVAAVVSNRFQVMAQYSKQVVARVHKDELRRADSWERVLLRRVKRLLTREESRMDEASKQKLASVLSRNDTLHTVYHFRQRLQEIWQRSTATHEHLLQALQEWCRQAEASGIKALQDFSRTLRSYTQQSSMASA